MSDKDNTLMQLLMEAEYLANEAMAAAEATRDKVRLAVEELRRQQQEK